MPRPKVLEDSRRRVAKACLYCQASKSKCDGQKPCAPCVRRSRSSGCAYSAHERSYGVHRRRTERTRRVTSAQQLSTGSSADEEIMQPTPLRRSQPMPTPSQDIPIPEMTGPMYDNKGRLGESRDFKKDVVLHPLFRPDTYE
jgi:hypothetical protein